MTASDRPLHSQEWISDARFSWWNPDYIELLLRRCRIENVRQVADVGVGAGHWSSLLALHAPHPIEVTGIDMEPEWLDAAAETFRRIAPQASFRGLRGDAHALPLPDESVDLTTCQTVLMHCRDPLKVLLEMVRVTRRGGCVLAVEPVNLFNRSLATYGLLNLDPIERGFLLTLWSYYHQGRQKEQSADHDIGMRLPQLCEDAGLTNVAMYTCDQSDIVDPLELNAANMIADYSNEENERFIKAGGGSPSDLDRGREIIEKMVDRARAGKAKFATFSPNYIAIGWKE